MSLPTSGAYLWHKSKMLFTDPAFSCQQFGEGNLSDCYASSVQQIFIGIYLTMGWYRQTFIAQSAIGRCNFWNQIQEFWDTCSDLDFKEDSFNHFKSLFRQIKLLNWVF